MLVHGIVYLKYSYVIIILYSNNTEGTVLASAAHAGRDHIVAYLLSIGASPNGLIERYNLKVKNYAVAILQ